MVIYKLYFIIKNMMMNLLSKIANALTSLKNNKNTMPAYIEERLIGDVRVCPVTEQFYVQAINGERFVVSSKDSDIIARQEKFFYSPTIECVVRKTNRVNSYYVAEFAGTVVENTITLL
jgi:hypothetical protein